MQQFNNQQNPELLHIVSRCCCTKLQQHLFFSFSFNGPLCKTIDQAETVYAQILIQSRALNICKTWQTTRQLFIITLKCTVSYSTLRHHQHDNACPMMPVLVQNSTPRSPTCRYYKSLHEMLGIRRDGTKSKKKDNATNVQKHIRRQLPVATNVVLKYTSAINMLLITVIWVFLPSAQVKQLKKRPYRIPKPLETNFDGQVQRC